MTRGNDIWRRFDVWAPEATHLELDVEGDRYTLHADARRNGWWRPSADDRAALEARASEAQDGISYGYRINGDALLPDPRSRWQPDGVHRASRTLPDSVTARPVPSWTGRQLAGGVVMEVHIGCFTEAGTFAGAIERLPELQELGISFIELLPVAAFGGHHGWGYDGVDWFAVHEVYGGPRGYHDFVAACHEHGIGVIQDVVYNHFGPSGNYLPKFGPYLADHHHTVWGQAINLDGPWSDEVRRYILDNVRMWAYEYDVDALRLDAVHALVDTRATTILEEMSMLAEEISAARGRPFTLIAESDLNDPRTITPREAGGLGVDAQWSDDFHHALHVAVTGDRSGYFADFDGVTALAKVWSGGFFHDGSISSFRGRTHGRILDPRTPSWRLVVCDQNHDQVGNRADGSRWTDRLSIDQQRLSLAVTLLSPFTPMLFMGEEWGATTPFCFFSDHQEPELALATSSGRLREFARMGWDESKVPDPQAEDTFLASKLDWTEREASPHRELWDFTKALIAFRAARPEFANPWRESRDIEARADEELFIVRTSTLSLVANFSADERTVDVSATRLLFASGGGELEDGTVTLPAHTLVVVE